MINMNLKPIFISCLFILSCTSSIEEKTDYKLLENDQQLLENSMNNYKVLLYKFGKISMRSAILEEPISEEHRTFHNRLQKVSNKLEQRNPDGSLRLSALDYISIFRDYRAMKAYIKKTDEDIFPTLTQGMAKDGKQKIIPLSAEEKILEQNIEHALLSIFVMTSRDFGKEIALYECSKTNPDLLPDGEIKTLLQYYRGILFFDKGLYYLSEYEISRNIDWLKKNPSIDLPHTRTIFNWVGANQKDSHIGYLAINHLFRGFDRLMMEREIDEQRALEDFEAFLNGANKLGLHNEATWSIEVYLHLKRQNPQQAIVALQKLQSSTLLSSKEKQSINEAIEYLHNRDSGETLNAIYDKYFLSKIVMKYMLSVLREVDWKTVLSEKEIPYVDQAVQSLRAFDSFIQNMEHYTDGEELKEAGRALQKKGSDWLDKAKDLIEE